MLKKDPSAPHTRRLRALLVVLGYGHRNGQKEFAAEIGVDYNVFNNIVNGSALSKPVAFAVFERFGITLEFLWYGLPGYGLARDIEQGIRDWERQTGERVFFWPSQTRRKRF